MNIGFSTYSAITKLKGTDQINNAQISSFYNGNFKLIYENKVIKPICQSKLNFCCLLEKLTKNCIFSVNDTLAKQIKGCPMGGAISVIMSGIHMKRMEKDFKILPL